MADELDGLYQAKPDEFTALRAELANAAKKRGDAAAAKGISGARKPTAAAWVVNRLAISDGAAKRRLSDLGARLRDAHAAMDGDLIRELSREQRKLIEQLTRQAFDTAELTDPSAALRDHVTSTLQAAIADPDVAARLGRLTKAEQWSGFGDFGAAAAVQKPTKRKPAENETARAALETAEQAKAEADDALSERKAELSAARFRRDEACRELEEAERTLTAAGDAHRKADKASRDAAEMVKKARAKLR
jgi:chromosome segregation ATPase